MAHSILSRKRSVRWCRRRPPAALAAGALADVEILQQHREAQLQDLRVGQARIGHVGVDAVGAVEAAAAFAPAGEPEQIVS